MLNDTSSVSSSSDAQPQPEEIRSALEHLLSQPEFQGSNRVKKFLTFVVERHLDGQQDLLKAQPIAVHVFDRDENFDAHANPIVRVEATRLRKVLRAVYDRPDFNERVEIELPLGSYAPNFRYRNVQQSVADHRSNSYAAMLTFDAFIKSQCEQIESRISQYRWRKRALFALGGLIFLSFYMLLDGGYENAKLRIEELTNDGDLRPVVFVAPFTQRNMTPKEQLGHVRIQRDLIDALSRFDLLRVRSAGDSAERADFEIVSNFASAPVGPALSLQRGDRSPVTAHQVPMPTEDLSQYMLSPTRAEVMKSVAKFANGVEFDLQMRNRRGQSLPDGLACVARLREYQSLGGEAARESAVQCLKAVVAQNRPDAFLAHARLSSIFFDDYAIGRKLSDDRDAMQEAFRHAQQSMQAASSRAAGLSAFARILLMTSADDATALQLARTAYLANPFDPDARAILGSMLVVLGRYEEGVSHLRAVCDDFPNYPSWIRLYLYVAAVEMGDVEGQRGHVAVADRSESPFTILARLAMNAMEDNRTAGEEAYNRLLAINQNMAEIPASVLMRLRFRGPKMQEVIRKLTSPPMPSSPPMPAPPSQPSLQLR